MYNDFDHRELWVKVLDVVFGGLTTEILTKVIASNIIIENGKGILNIQSIFLSSRFERKTILSFENQGFLSVVLF